MEKERRILNDEINLKDYLVKVIKLKTDHIKEFFSEKIEAVKESLGLKTTALEQAVDLKNKSIQVAVELAAKALEQRLSSMNEFRKQIERVEVDFMKREEYNIQHNRLVEDIKILNSFKDKLEGKASQKSVNITLGISIVSGVIALLAVMSIFGKKTPFRFCL